MMIYCPECGVEVAPNDVFCQYCGIGLTPIPTGDIAKESLKVTPIKEPQAEVLQPLENSSLKSEPIPTAEIAIEDSIPATPLVLTEDFQPPVAHLDELLNEKTADYPNTPTADFQIPTTAPQILQSEPAFEPESNPVIVAPVEEQTTLNDSAPLELKVEPTLVESSEIENENLAEIPVIESPIVETPIIEPSVIESPKIETPVVEIIAEPIETPANIEVKNETADSFDSTIPSVPSDFVKNDLQFTNSEINALEEKIVDQKAEIEIPIPTVIEPIIQPQVETVMEISQPPIPEPVAEVPDATDLAENTPTIIRSEFPVIVPVDLADLPPVFIAPPIEKPVEQVVAATPISEEVAPESRSYTNPIGNEAVDTGNKTKAKLQPLVEGTVLNNRYEIVRKIGGGGMGAVYLASDKNLGGVLRAVKEMVQSYIEEAQQDKAISDFKRESLLLTSLDHVAIPTIFDYFYDDKEARFYLVMKYISGGDLSGRMRSSSEGRVDEVSVTDWAIQIADVLEYLHRHEPPIVYRDLKPSNIMLDGNSGKVMLIDFGIARWVNKEEKGVTAVGTMGYAPPELFSGNVEPRSDIYSLGSTIFHLLTGADPQSNPLLIFDFSKNPRPRQINSQLSDQIEQILMRAVEYNAAQRFSSAAEMRDALAKHLDNLKRGTVTFGVMTPVSGAPISGNLPVFCGFCGQKILATDMFCPFCGAQQPLAGQSQNVSSAPVYTAPKSAVRLTIVGTNDLEHTEFNLEKDNNLVGRRDPMSNIFPEVDLSKYDPQTKISRKHARIWRENDVFMLEDLGSSNGTIIISINNESNRLLPRQPHVLANGNRIRVGDTTLIFTVG